MLVHFLTDRVGAGDPPHTSYQHRVFYVGSDVRASRRRALRESGLAWSICRSRSRRAALFEHGQIPLDVAMVQVAPPDPDGTCSLGISVDVTRAAALAARTVIAEVNPRCLGPPATVGSRSIGSRASCRCRHPDRGVHARPRRRGGRADRSLRRRLIDDRSTLQIGLGRVPNEMLARLSNRRELAIHSDVITEPIVDLVAAGVVTGPVRRAGRWARGVSTTSWTTIRASRFIRSSTSATRRSSRAGSGWCR